MPDANPPAGLFRTPLACALLSGALAAAVDRVFWHFQYHVWFSVAFLHCVKQFLICFLLLSGPLLCVRNASAFLRTGAMAMALTGVTCVIQFNVFPLTKGIVQFRTALLIYEVFPTLVQASMLGFLLCVLYRATCSRARCILLAIMGVLPSVFETLHWYLSNTPYFFPGRSQSKEHLAYISLLTIFTFVAQVVLPTIPIDRAFRAHARANLGGAHA